MSRLSVFLCGIIVILALSLDLFFAKTIGHISLLFLILSKCKDLSTIYSMGHPPLQNLLTPFSFDLS